VVSVTRALGALLIVVGLVAYFATGADSPTALLPAALGALLLILGLVAGRESLRRHAVHAALAIALLGILGTAMNLAEVPALLRGDAERPAAVVSSLVTALALLVYLVLGIRSFVEARRARAA
jgi:uncharacterized membrane protein HdeD (DUF308 family)